MYLVRQFSDNCIFCVSIAAKTRIEKLLLQLNVLLVMYGAILSGAKARERIHVISIVNKFFLLHRVNSNNSTFLSLLRNLFTNQQTNRSYM